MDLSPDKLLVLGLIAVMVLGPERLPHAARTAGRMLAELRRLSASVHSDVAHAMAEPRKAFDATVGDVGLSDVSAQLTRARTSVRGALDELVNGAARPGSPRTDLHGATGAPPPPAVVTPGPGEPASALFAGPGPDDAELN